MRGSGIAHNPFFFGLCVLPIGGNYGTEGIVILPSVSATETHTVAHYRSASCVLIFHRPASDRWHRARNERRAASCPTTPPSTYYYIPEWKYVEGNSDWLQTFLRTLGFYFQDYFRDYFFNLQRAGKMRSACGPSARFEAGRYLVSGYPHLVRNQSSTS